MNKSILCRNIGTVLIIAAAVVIWISSINSCWIENCFVISVVLFGLGLIVRCTSLEILGITYAFDKSTTISKASKQMDPRSRFWTWLMWLAIAVWIGGLYWTQLCLSINGG